MQDLKMSICTSDVIRRNIKMLQLRTISNTCRIVPRSPLNVWLKWSKLIVPTKQC